MTELLLSLSTFRSLGLINIFAFSPFLYTKIFKDLLSKVSNYLFFVEQMLTRITLLPVSTH
jgi:hypothetical protein